MLKLNEDGFCDLCRSHTDHKDLHFAEDQDCNFYYACGLCKEILEDAELINEDGYMLLNSKQTNCLRNGVKIIQNGAVMKIWSEETAA